MSGRVVCGLCQRRMSIMRNGQGQSHYRCRHRGSSCKISSRSNLGLLRAAGLALSLLCDDGIRQAVRRHLEASGRMARQRHRPPAPSVDERLTELRDQRDKLLRLHYAGHLSADQFGAEQARLTIEIDNLEADTATAANPGAPRRGRHRQVRRARRRPRPHQHRSGLGRRHRGRTPHPARRAARLGHGPPRPPGRGGPRRPTVAGGLRGSRPQVPARLGVSWCRRGDLNAAALGDKAYQYVPICAGQR